MQAKKFLNGTHRTQAPENTFRKVEPFLRKMGITRVANITGLDEIGIPVYAACRPNSKSLSVSQGKGHCDYSAKVSAVMESIEGYHAENITLPIVHSTYKILRSKEYNMVNIDRLARSLDRDFCEDSTVLWVECKEVVSKKSVWAPYEIINAAFTVPVTDDYGYFIADSNGLASGNTLSEAINHALFEVIERDCLALWQLTPENIQSQKRIDIETIEEPFLKKMIGKLKSSNIHIGVWNLTNDLNIPTFLCKIISDRNIGVRPAYGSGTHLNKNIALSRAITEAAQSRLTFISGARDDQYEEIYESEISSEVYQSWLDKLHNTSAAILNDFAQIISKDFDHIEEDQEYVLEQLSKAGLDQVIYADLTKSQFGIPVVKVVVPGLEGVTYPDRRLLGERAIEYYEKYGVGACEMTS